MMDHSFLCVLGLFWLYTLLCTGHTQGAVLTIDPNWSTFYTGESVTFICDMKEGTNTDWKYRILKDGREFIPYNSNSRFTLKLLYISYKDEYQCCGRLKTSHDSKCSNKIFLNVRADKPRAEVTAGTTTISVGGSVTLSCSVDNSAGWKYQWFRRTSHTSEFNFKTNDEQNRIISVSQGGIYRCRGERGDPAFYSDMSHEASINITFSNQVVVTRQPDWPQIFSGEKITLTCEIQGGETTEWMCVWRHLGSIMAQISSKQLTFTVSERSSGDYQCQCKRRDDSYSSTKWSEAIRLSVSEDEAKATLTADSSILPAGGSVTLTCSLKIPAGFTYNLYRNNYMKQSDEPGGVFKISEGGKYTCRGFRRDTNFITSFSNTVFIQQTVSMKSTVVLQPSWTLIYRGETITARCEIQEGGGTQWTYEWRTTRLNRPPSSREHRISRVTDSGDYSCRGRRDEFYLTQWSDVVSVTVSASKPRARLAADSSILPAGGSVTLTCSVDHSADWKFNWFRDGSVYPAAQLRNNNEPGGVIRVSQGGLYRCRGGRGEPVFYTEDSHVVTIEETLSMKPTVVLQPSWTLIYRGETITVRCEIQEGGGTQWTYEWSTTRLNRPPSYREHRISRVTDSGDYSCRGRRDEFYLTQWSDVVSVTVSADKPRPVLSVSPSWLSPGSSVTLRCEIKPPSAGWRFYWYKAVPDLLNNRYSYDLLPGSTAGTEHDSYIIHGQTHTAGYVCRAGRGDTEYHTDYSEVKFLWSADVHPAASLTVNPDRVQHFTSDSVSLNCGGNSTKWRVMRFTETHHLSRCSSWGRMTGSSCNMNMNWYHSGVYWCESGSGEFSNTVNITVQNFYDGVILVSPVHPVTEGASVSLSCRRRKQNTLSSVSFYHNDKLLQHDGREELNISAVSQSDEGFYKCQHAGKTSQQSWMSVTAVSRPESSSFPVLLMVGSVIGIILLVFLLLLCLCKRSKDLCCIRWIQSQSSSQSSSSHPGVNQNETNQYSSPLHDADESRDGTYSLIELKHFGKKRRHHEPEESCVYSEVKTGTAESTPVYAEINHENKGKAKRKNKKSTPVYAEINHENKGKAKRKNKRKWSPAAGDAAVYSEVGLGAALDNNAAM
ncbi:Fc receptor-like protein 5 isoform X10 [Melanotaenia boesemani]|uniref:Fc receptor-like protein 5 isoform X10 n=1 Tax=Melanotaenia boesemani TaxID=1250792 RepID=UPI001C05431C|nr:Fc receptor-like protein 5 isoform X10 [Melanotaenia boesemani]